jgi:tetratricopeptide (TPR) repeat protein
MEEAVRRRDEGTKEFMLGNYSAAVDLYASAAELVERTTSRELSDVEAELYIKCWGNAALCFAKEKSWNDVIFCCNKILDKYSNEFRTNIKMVYRRGLANMHLDKYEDARADLNAALAIDGTNRDVRAAIRELKARVVRSNSKEKTRFGGMFGRISMYDDKSFNLTLVPTAKGDELIGFPDTVLASVAQFLTKTERALVAVAMTASSKSWGESKWRKRPSEASRVMIAARPMKKVKFNYRLKQSYEWDTLDFMDIDKALAKK